MALSFETSTADGLTLMTLSGRLTFSEVKTFPLVLQAMGSQGCDFDLHRIEAIDSTGLSLFIHAYDAANKGGFSISVSGASGPVAAALARAGFAALFSISG